MSEVLKILKILLFLLLLPLYAPAYVLMQFTFKWWTELLGGD